MESYKWTYTGEGIMTTEHSKESKPQKTPQPKPVPVASQDNEFALPSLDLTPQNILRLQRTIGNAAVMRMLAQRQPDEVADATDTETDTATDEAAPTEEESSEDETQSEE